MDNFSIKFSDIASILALIGSIWGVVKIYREMKQPSSELRRKVERNSQRLDELEHKIESGENNDHIILECLLVIMNHEINGNSIDGLVGMRDKLQEYLIKRKE